MLAFLKRLLDASESSTHASDILRDMCPGCTTTKKNGYLSLLERHADTDGAVYELEYVSTPDGRRAIAFCRLNPWSSTPNAGVDYHVGHVAPNGFLCLGGGLKSQRLADSPHSLEYVIKRARYWCSAFSFFKEHGSFPQL